ncbi:MAG: UDP-glucose/GDP-mannose dehydrogenase family protein [Candidatus Peribacteraceae bacterium]
MKIAIIGTGYVGLVSAACFAELGHVVVGVDIDANKVAMLKKGKSPIYEPGLEELIERNLKSGRLSFTTELKDALPGSIMVFSAVATPPGEGYKADLRAVFSVAESVASLADTDVIFINKSTVPIGTGGECQKKIDSILKKRGVSISIPVVSNPEFLREGMAVTDTMMPDRIVIGLNDDAQSQLSKAKSLLEDLYRPITRVGKPIVFMSRESAEIVKYASNAFLATKISFINMLTDLCEKGGASIRDVATGMGLDNRIGPKFLHAGIGYGGSCFPKDVKALMATAEEYGVSMPIIEATDQINIEQRQNFIDKIFSHIGTEGGKTLAIWGLSFKPKTDDMREAPSINVVNALADAGHTIVAFDPVATERAKPLLHSSVKYAESHMDAAKNADAVIVLTEWDEFRGIDLLALADTMRGKHLFDGRNIYEPEEVQEAGLKYVGIGIG